MEEINLSQFCHSKWYGLPAEEQKWHILLSQRSQFFLQLNGYKIINCSLETFVAVRFDISSIIINKLT